MRVLKRAHPPHPHIQWIYQSNTIHDQLNQNVLCVNPFKSIDVFFSERHHRIDWRRQNPRRHWDDVAGIQSYHLREVGQNNEETMRTHNRKRPILGCVFFPFSPALSRKYLKKIYAVVKLQRERGAKIPIEFQNSIKMKDGFINLAG